MNTIVFDVGNVLIRWDVAALYSQLLPDADAIEEFLTETGLLTMNIEFDRGLPFAEGLAELAEKFPHRAALLMAFKDRWPETVTGAIEESVAVLDALHARSMPLYAITNFSAETWPLAVERYPFLGTHFLDVVVSGEVGLIKPGAEIYELLLSRNKLTASECIFIDDSAANIEAARAVGMRAIHLTDPAQLRGELAKLGVEV